MADGTVALVLVDVAAWTGLCVAVGYAGHRLPTSALQRDTWLTALHPVERDGGPWLRLGVRRWKDALPEAGGFFGGISKRHLGSASDVERLVLETRRAELVHWTLAATGPLFALWNPPGLAAFLVAFAVAFNAPFIVVQRFNRARLLRVLERRGAPVRTRGGA